MKTDQRDGGDRGSRGYSRCNVRKCDSESMKRCWMAMGSKIEGTDATGNPVRGCTKISPGCKHCYAETFAERFRGVKGHPYEQGFDLRLVPGKLGEPLKWRAPKMVFWNLVGVLFFGFVGGWYILAVGGGVGGGQRHTESVLSQQSGRGGCLLYNEHTLAWGRP